MIKILLIEDDRSLGATLKERLEKEGYSLSWSMNLAEAKESFRNNSFQLIVLDVGLPDGTGYEFAKFIRQRSTVPFLFVTAQNSAEDRLEAYELGAEEFIPKPFHLKELLLRVRHVLENHATKEKLQIGSVEIDFESMSLRMESGERKFLSARDFHLLKILIEQSPRVISRDEILDKVWGEERFPSNRTIDNSIVRLRSFFPGDSIRSVRGIGYQWSGLIGG